MLVHILQGDIFRFIKKNSHILAQAVKSIKPVAHGAKSRAGIFDSDYAGLDFRNPHCRFKKLARAPNLLGAFCFNMRKMGCKAILARGIVIVINAFKIKSVVFNIIIAVYLKINTEKRFCNNRHFPDIRIIRSKLQIFNQKIFAIDNGNIGCLSVYIKLCAAKIKFRIFNAAKSKRAPVFVRRFTVFKFGIAHGVCYIKHSTLQLCAFNIIITLIKNDFLFILDFGNRRKQIFKPNGNFFIRQNAVIVCINKHIFLLKFSAETLFIIYFKPP